MNLNQFNEQNQFGYENSMDLVDTESISNWNVMDGNSMNYESHYVNVDQDESQFNYSFHPNMIPSSRTKSNVTYSDGGVLSGDLLELSRLSHTVRKDVIEDEKAPKRIKEKIQKKEKKIEQGIGLPSISMFEKVEEREERINSYIASTSHFDIKKVVSIPNHEQEIVRDKNSRFWITKKNVEENKSIQYPHNVISINWEFECVSCPYFVRNDLFRGLICYYSRKAPKGMENMYKAKLNLYMNHKNYFAKMTILKAFRLNDENGYQGNQPFNVFLTLLKVIKGFQRELSITCSITSKRSKYKPLNIDIHIIKVEGSNIAIGEQTVNGTIYPFFMTSEEIIHDGKYNTYVFSNLLIPHENIKQIGDKEKYLELREEPWWINHSNETVCDVFQSRLKNWKGKDYDIFETNYDEPIYNVPDSKEEIQLLYQTKQVMMNGIRESDEGVQTGFVFKISFPYSYYTKERVNCTDMYVENFPSMEGETPFIRRNEFFELLKVICTYCNLEDIPNDELIENQIKELTQLPKPDPITLSGMDFLYEMNELPQIMPEPSSYHNYMNIPMDEDYDLSFHHDENPPPELC